MSMYDSRQPYPSWYDDEIDISMCKDCPYIYGVCWKAGYCIVEDVN